MKLKWLFPVLAAGCLTAQAAEPVRAGLELTGSAATGSLKQSTGSGLGSGLGLFLDQALHDQGTLRWSLGHSSSFGSRAYTFHGAENSGQERFRLNRLSTMVTYMHHLQERERGAYLLAGLGAASYAGGAWDAGSLEVEKMPGLQAGSGVFVSTGTKLAYQAGAGYDFNRTWGVNARYQALKSQGRTLGSIDFGVTCRF